ncbi:MAG: hypothetical protein Q610_ECBC00409G0001, partial [Escherichia coli DORA_B_14]
FQYPDDVPAKHAWHHQFSGGMDEVRRADVDR